MSQPSPTRPPEHPEQQVVVAYDFSAAAAVVLDRAIAVVQRAPFHTLHVIAVIDSRIGLPAVPADGPIDYHYAERVQHELGQIVITGLIAAQASREVQTFAHARFGKPAVEILRLAEEVGADLIIVGSHNHTGVRRWLLGSTAERVVREAGCPVVVARPKTYHPVERVSVVEIEPHAGHYVPPHRYHYDDPRSLTRPPDWPLL
jgi:nucleotide-binding universal stress UspA family protein